MPVRLLLLLIAAPGAVIAGPAGAQSYVGGQLQVAPQSPPNNEYLSAAGAMMSPPIPFYRIGEPVIVPFTPTSGVSPVGTAASPSGYGYILQNGATNIGINGGRATGNASAAVADNTASTAKVRVSGVLGQADIAKN